MEPTGTQIQSTILKLVEEMAEELELEGEDPVSLEDHLIGDLDFSSVDFVQLFVSIEKQFQQKLGFHDLIVQDGRYVDDLTVAQVAAYAEGKLQSATATEASSPKTQVAPVAVGSRLDGTEIAQFRQAIPSPPASALPRAGEPKNPPALFILSPSRSGSTLLRVMLAGHPQLFAPPELHLLYFQNLHQRREALSNEMNQHLLFGTVEALMQVKGCSLEAAQALMDRWERQAMPVQEFYRRLQQDLGSRLLIDKTPSYAYHANLLGIAEAYFSEPLYLHLTRHPGATIRSFEQAKLDRLLPFMQSGAFSRREYAELAWLVCQQNILEFLQGVPDSRQLRLKFEDLVSQPEIAIQQICYFLGLDFHPPMLDPYQETERRMAAGMGQVARMSGDLKFYLHQGIDPTVADRWRQYDREDSLSDLTWKVAEELGYYPQDR